MHYGKITTPTQYSQIPGIGRHSPSLLRATKNQQENSATASILSILPLLAAWQQGFPSSVNAHLKNIATQ